jgi:hypothetical protein
MSTAPLIAEVVDWDGLLRVLWASSLAGVGVSVAFAVAILGTTRAVDRRRDGRTAEAGLFAVVGAVALAAVAAAIALGIVAMISK